MELLLHMVALFLVFCKSSIVFSTENAPIYIPNNSAQGFPFLHILTNICYLCFLMTAILKSVRWYHIVVLICISRAVKSLLQYHNLKASVLQHSAFFMVHLSHLYMTTGKAIALTLWTFVSKMMSLLFNTLSKFVIAFLSRNNHLISWLPSPTTVILEPKKRKSVTASRSPHLFAMKW